MTSEIVRLPREELEQGYQEYYTFTLQEPECALLDWREDLRVGVEYNMTRRGNMNSFEMIRSLANEVIQSDDFLGVMRQDIYSSELFFLLKFMTFSRLNYAWFMGYIAEQCDVANLKPLAEKMVEISSIWRMVWLKFTKMTYIPKQEMARKILADIHNSILQVADQEESLAWALIEVIGP